MYDQNYGGYVWTKHALERLKARKLTQSEVFSAIVNPTTSIAGSATGSIKYRQLNSAKLVEAVIKIDKGKRIILTCWSEPRTKFKSRIPLWEKAMRKLFPILFK